MIEGFCMDDIRVGSEAPGFYLLNQDGDTVCLEAFRGAHRARAVKEKLLELKGE